MLIKTKAVYEVRTTAVFVFFICFFFMCVSVCCLFFRLLVCESEGA